MDFVIFCGK